MGTQAVASAPLVSIIVPLGARHDALGSLYRELRRVMPASAGPYEVLFVDDATEPQTRKELLALRAACPEIRIIRFPRRMGEATALAVGSQAARGEILITVDPYLHVSPECLPSLLEEIRQGADLVCTWRHPRRESGLSWLASEGFNAAARWLTKVPVHDLNSRTRAMRRALLQDLPLYGELHRFLPIFAARRGYRWCEVQVPQQPGKREVGALALGAYVRRLMDLMTLAFLTRFVKRPLHLFGLLGAASFGAGLVIALYLTYVKLVLDLAIGHRPLLLLAVLLIVVGLQIASIGLLGELMIFTHARDMKDYVVKEELS